jgi:hypothetical protein
MIFIGGFSAKTRIDGAYTCVDPVAGMFIYRTEKQFFGMLGVNTVPVILSQYPDRRAGEGQ